VVLVTAFFVRGRPVPQGSLKFIQGRPIHARAADLAVWRADIAREAQLHGHSPTDGAYRIKCSFTYFKPKSATRTYPSVKPDLDKLVRAVLDGLTGVAYMDDCQVVAIEAIKTYNNAEGVWIDIERVA